MVAFDSNGSIRQKPHNNQQAQQEGGTTREQEGSARGDNAITSKSSAALPL
jgi:hypothetical protein